MFSRLGLKLFGAILLVNVLLGALIFFAAARSIDDDFLGYLRRTQEARIDTLSETLVEGYARHGSWDWISEDRTACTTESVAGPSARRAIGKGRAGPGSAVQPPSLPRGAP